MADTTITNLPVASPLSTDVFPIVNNGTTKQVSLSSAFTNLVSLSGVVTNNSSYIYVTTTSNTTVNGTNLLNAYATACALTPNGSALSSTNRAVVILMPGTYTTTSGLQLSAQYVDIVGMSSDANHTIIDIVNQTANDVQVSNITVATNGCTLASNLSLTIWTNCVVSNSIDYGGGFGNNILSGTFTNCTGSSSSSTYHSGGGFGGVSSTLSGTFTNCTGSNSSIYAGGFGGYLSTLSGTFTNCTGSNSGGYGYGFCGYLSTLSGTFINCFSQTDIGFANGPGTAKIRNYVDANGNIYNYN